MTIRENLTEFHGKPVVDFRESGDISDFAACAPRVRCEYEDEKTIADYIALMLEQPGSKATEALVIGLWVENGEAVDATPSEGLELLVSRRDDLPNLKALFIGDIISEENEISWINQGDMSSLWGAFPKLDAFGARGGNGLRLGKINHAALRKLVIESGGLSAPVVREALDANAPLEHLELWLGSDNYGANTSVEDFRALLDGRLFPNLKYLGLRDCEYTDELAGALAASAILDRIETVDLSLGTLTDRGAQALLDSGRLGGLKALDITHHYLSSEMLQTLRAALPNLVAGAPENPDNYRGETHYFVAVSE
jgi:hypothetical protein